MKKPSRPPVMHHSAPIMTRIGALCLALLLAMPAHAAIPVAALRQLVQQPGLSLPYTGVRIIDAETGNPILEQNATTPLMPASNLKVVTSSAALSLLKPEAYLVNTSRGTAIDEAALIDALEAGRIAGAGLDVFEHEPAIDSRLLALPNVVLLPHMGSATYEARSATGERVIRNIQHWADGHRPPDQVLEGWA